MSDEILAEATRALREQTLESDEGTRSTRNRVMASLHRHERRRRSRIVWLLPIAAVLAGTTAFASSGSGWQTVAAAIGISDPPPPPVVAIAKRARLEPAPARVAPPEPEPEPEREADEPKADEPAPAASGPRPAASRARELREPNAEDPTLELYREAHRLHFGAGDSSAALAAWDRYLASAPRGRFAVEARYNRAICLVRLGRRDEALSALAPFARGAYGAYRQSSAQELVRSLGGESEVSE